MKIKGLITQSFWMMTIGGSIITSCVDNKYDLSNISGSMRFGGDTLRLPICSVDEIALKNVLDETDIFYSKDGSYYITKKGEINVNPVSFEEVSVKSPNIKDNNTSMDLNNNKISMTKRKAPGAGFDWGYLVNQSASEIEMKATPVTKDVVDVESFGSQPTEFNMKISMGKLADCVKQLHANSFKINIPKGLDISKISLNGKTLDYDEKWQEGEITFPKEMDVKSAENSLDIVIEGGTEKSEAYYFDSENNTIKVMGKVEVSGEFGFNESDLKEDKKMDDVPNSADLNVESSMSETKLTSLTGVVKHKLDIEEPKSMKLSDIPEFLDDDETVLDLKNPTIYITVGNNEVPLSANLDINLVAYDKNDKMIDEITVHDVKINSSGSTKCAVTNEGVLEDADQTINADIASLIRDIPARIEATIKNAEIKAQRVEDFDITREYKIENAAYSIDSKLEIGDKFCLVYRDTIDGWNEDIKDFAVKKILMKASAKNTLPVDMELTMTPIDVNTKRMSNVIITSENIKAEATTDVEICLEVKGETPEELLNTFRQLDGIILKAKAVKGVGAGRNLSPDGNVTLQDVRFSIIGGVYVDTDN